MESKNEKEVKLEELYYSAENTRKYGNLNFKPVTATEFYALPQAPEDGASKTTVSKAIQYGIPPEEQVKSTVSKNLYRIAEHKQIEAPETKTVVSYDIPYGHISSPTIFKKHTQQFSFLRSVWFWFSNIFGLREKIVEVSNYTQNNLVTERIGLVRNRITQQCYLLPLGSYIMDSTLEFSTVDLNQQHIQSGNVHIFNIPAGNAGKVMVDGFPYLIEAGKRVVITGDNVTYHGIGNLNQNFDHGDLHYFCPTQLNRVNKVTVDAKPICLEPGEPAVVISKNVIKDNQQGDLDSAYFRHGNIHYFNLPANQSKQVGQVFIDGNPYFIQPGVPVVIKGDNVSYHNTADLSQQYQVFGDVHMFNIPAGKLEGSITIDGKPFLIKQGEQVTIRGNNVKWYGLVDTSKEVITLGNKDQLINVSLGKLIWVKSKGDRSQWIPICGSASFYKDHNTIVHLKNPQEIDKPFYSAKGERQVFPSEAVDKDNNVLTYTLEYSLEIDTEKFQNAEFMQKIKPGPNYVSGKYYTLAEKRSGAVDEPSQVHLKILSLIKEELNKHNYKELSSFEDPAALKTGAEERRAESKQDDRVVSKEAKFDLQGMLTALKTKIKDELFDNYGVKLHDLQIFNIIQPEEHAKDKVVQQAAQDAQRKVQQLLNSNAEALAKFNIETDLRAAQLERQKVEAQLAQDREDQARELALKKAATEKVHSDAQIAMKSAEAKASFDATELQIQAKKLQGEMELELKTREQKADLEHQKNMAANAIPSEETQTLRTYFDVARQLTTQEDGSFDTNLAREFVINMMRVHVEGIKAEHQPAPVTLIPTLSGGLLNVGSPQLSAGCGFFPPAPPVPIVGSSDGLTVIPN